MEIPPEILLLILRAFTRQFSRQLITTSSSSSSTKTNSNSTSISSFDDLDNQSDWINFTRLELCRLKSVSKQFRDQVNVALEYFPLDFQHFCQLKLRSLLYKTHHPTNHIPFEDQTIPTNSNLSFDIRRIIMQPSASNSSIIEYSPVSTSTATLEFSSNDSVCELSLSIPYSSVSKTLADKVFRFDMGAAEGIHYTMDYYCCLVYQLSRLSLVTIRSIQKADSSIVEIPVSSTLITVTISKLRVFTTYLIPTNIPNSPHFLTNVRISRLASLLGISDLDLLQRVNLSHELLLSYIHSNVDVSDTKISQLITIFQVLNGLADRKWLVSNAIQKMNPKEPFLESVLYETPEITRFIMQESPLISRHSDSMSRFISYEFCIVKDRKLFVLWNGTESLVTCAMIPAYYDETISHLLATHLFTE